ncbi:MAG: hypothetical protein Q9216_006117 [Gyalolechia sp. 2 TL-2023]
MTQILEAAIVVLINTSITNEITTASKVKMISRAALRASKATQASTSSTLARRTFHSTPARFDSPYHYPEGPLSNIPFNPRTKYFGVRYWGTMG